MINNLIGDWVETQIVYKGQGYLISGYGKKGSIKFNNNKSLEWTIVRYENYSGNLNGESSSTFMADWNVSRGKLVISNPSRGNLLSVLGNYLIINKLGSTFSLKYVVNGFGDEVIQIMMSDGAEHVYKRR